MGNIFSTLFDLCSADMQPYSDHIFFKNYPCCFAYKISAQAERGNAVSAKMHTYRVTA